MGGPAADNVAFDEEGQITLVRLAGSLAVLGLVLAYACFRRVTAALMILIVSSVSALASLAMVWWTGSRVDAVLWLMPPLVFVLGMAGAIYLINSYRDTSREQGIDGAPSRRWRRPRAPCILAAVTIAAGLFALCASDNSSRPQVRVLLRAGRAGHARSCSSHFCPPRSSYGHSSAHAHAPPPAAAGRLSRVRSLELASGRQSGGGPQLVGRRVCRGPDDLRWD